MSVGDGAATSLSARSAVRRKRSSDGLYRATVNWSGSAPSGF